MKNSHLKNSLIAASIAVLAGVVTLGANVAFGDTAPIAQPNATTLVSPTFGGLDVRGDIKNGNLGPVNVNGDFKVTGDTALNGNVTLQPNKQVQFYYGGGFISLAADPIFQVLNVVGDTVFSHNVQVSAALDVRDYITNQLGPLVVQGDQHIVSGGLVVDKTTKSMGEINAASGILVSSGKIHGWLDFGSDVTAEGKMDVQGTISNSSANNLGTVRVGDDLSVDGDLSVMSKDLVMTGMSSKIRSSGSQPVEFGSDIITKNINVNGAGSYLTNSATHVVNVGAATNPNNLNVNGKITSTYGFGTYTFRPAATAVAISNGGFNWSLQGCNSGEIVVSCYANSYSADPGASFTAGESGDMSMSGLYIYNNKCEANYKNTSGVTRYVKAAALCLDNTK